MLNKICVDADYNIELIIWLQDPRTFDFTWDNSIVMHVNADGTANQQLVVTYGEESATIPVTSGIEQDIVINGAYWNMGGDTTVACEKDGSTVETFTFTFPDVIDSVGMLNQDENDDYHFTMTGSSTAPEVLEEQVKQNTEDVEQAKEDISDLYLNKQNFIHVDLLPPSGDGDEGDLKFYGTSPARLYRRENNAWVKKEWIAYGTQNPDAAPVEGDIFIENNGANLIRISQYVGGVWIDYTTGYGHLVDYLQAEQNTEVKYLDGSDIYQQSFYFSGGLSLAADTWVNAVQNVKFEQIIAAEGSNSNGDMIALIGRVNNGYAQVMSLMSAAQTLTTLTLKFIKASGAYVFNEDYQNNQWYALRSTANMEELMSDMIKLFVSKNRTLYPSAAIFPAFLAKSADMINHIMQNKGSAKGCGFNLTIGFSGTQPYRLTLEVRFEADLTKSVSVGSKHTDNGYEWYGNTNPYICQAGTGKTSYEAYMTGSDLNNIYYSTDSTGINITNIGIRLDGGSTGYQIYTSTYGIHK